MLPISPVFNFTKEFDSNVKDLIKLTCLLGQGSYLPGGQSWITQKHHLYVGVSFRDEQLSNDMS